MLREKVKKKRTGHGRGGYDVGGTATAAAVDAVRRYRARSADGAAPAVVAVPGTAAKVAADIAAKEMAGTAAALSRSSNSHRSRRSSFRRRRWR